MRTISMIFLKPQHGIDMILGSEFLISTWFVLVTILKVEKVSPKLNPNSSFSFIYTELHK